MVIEQFSNALPGACMIPPDKPLQRSGTDKVPGRGRGDVVLAQGMHARVRLGQCTAAERHSWAAYVADFQTLVAIVSLVVAVGAMLTAARPALAHHSRAMFDMTKNVTYRGVVQEYRWQNPHSHIVVTVLPDAADLSTAGTWDIEASAVDLMTTRGWTPTTYKAGDVVTIVAHPNRNGSRIVLLFYAIKADGTRLYRAAHRYPGEVE
jgi:hypothetical protein